MEPAYPHDAFIKDIMTEISLASEILRISLEPQIAAELNWSTLAREESTFIDEELKESRSDALFSVKTIKGSLLQVYLLFEHKSTVDRNIHRQLLKYLQQIYNRQKKLTVVVPVVLYHGQKSWQVHNSFIEAFNLNKEDSEIFRRYIPDFSYELNNLNVRQVEQLETEKIIQSILLLLKNIHRMNNDEQLAYFLKFSYELFTSNDLKKTVEKMFKYLYFNVDYSKEQLKQVISRRLSPEKSELIMSTAELLIQEGREEGREEGKIKANIETARKMIAEGFDVETVVRMTGLSEKQLTDHDILNR